MARDPSAGLSASTTVACDLCGSSDAAVVYENSVVRPLEASDFTVYGELTEHPRIVRCLDCSLVYASPRDSVEALREKYLAMPAEPYLEEQAGREAAFRRLLTVLRRFVPRGAVLDVGCSAGMFLRSLPEMYEGYGLEPSRAAATVAREHFGDRITVADVEDAEFAPESFDLVTLWDVLEHVGSPQRVLARMHPWVRPDGHLALMTPNFGSLTARLLGTRWHNLIRQHLFYFTAESLTQLLEATGFKVVRRSSWVRTHSLGYVLKRAHCSWTAKMGSRGGLMERLMRVMVPVPLFDDLFVIAQKVAVPVLSTEGDRMAIASR